MTRKTGTRIKSPGKKEDMIHDDWMVVGDKRGKEKEGIKKG